MEKINIGGTDKDWENYYILGWLEENQRELVRTLHSDDEKKKELSTQYNIWQKSKKHLKDSSMSYWYHFWHSVSNGNKLFYYALSSYAHAILPGKLKQHAARGIISMYEDMKAWPHLRRAMYEISSKK